MKGKASYVKKLTKTSQQCHIGINIEYFVAYFTFSTSGTKKLKLSIIFCYNLKTTNTFKTHKTGMEFKPCQAVQ